MLHQRVAAFGLLLVCLFVFGIGGAHAQACQMPSRLGAYNNANPATVYATREAAQAACNSVVSPSAESAGGGWYERVDKVGCTLNVAQKSFTLTSKVDTAFESTNCTMIGGASPRTYTSTGWGFTGEICPSGQTWDAGSQSCYSPDRCLAKNDALGNALTTTQTSTNGCFDGCAMSMGPTYETRVLTGPSGQQVTVFRGNMRYTGAACSTPTKAPDDKTPECKPVDGMTFCHKDDGQTCGKASNGRLVCWGPGETGEKSDGSTKQVRQAGPTATPPSLQLPNGDTLTKTGPTVVSQQSGAVPGAVTQNITTNITNYNTTNGTNAGPTNQGENGNGDGGGKEDDGDDDKGNAKLSGGTSCDVPPVCDVVDDAMCKSGIITWKFQCDGAAEVGSAQQEAQTAVDLLNMTWDEEEGQFADGAIQRYNETRAALAQDVIDVGESNDWDLLDSSGFLGGGTCPQIPPLSVGATTIPFDFGPICSLFASLGLLVEALAYFVALRILTAP